MAKTAAVLRVYEYVSDDGTIYWSLTQSPQTVQSPQRLYLQDKKGLMVGHFIGNLRLRALAQTTGVTEDEVG